MDEYCDGCFDNVKNTGPTRELFIGPMPQEFMQTMKLCEKCFNREMMFRRIRNKNRPDDKPLEILSFGKRKK